MSPLVHSTLAFRNFMDYLEKRPRPCVLDLGYVCGRNIEYLCNLGMKVYVEDILITLARREQEDEGEKSDLLEGFSYREDFFDGIIYWDVLDYLEREVGLALVQRCFSLLKRDGFVFAIFNLELGSQSKEQVVYRIMNRGRFEYLSAGQERDRKVVYKNREIIKIFSGFKLLNFYFLDNSLREALIQKES